MEVTITIAIVAIGLVVVIRAINTSIHVASASLRYDQAIQLAYEKMFAIDVVSAFENATFDTAETKGVFAQNPAFRWEYGFSPMEDYNLSKAVLIISWKEGRRQGSIDLATLIKPREE